MSSPGSSELKVSYWLETIITDNEEWNIFTAVCRSGLIMSSLLGSGKDEEKCLHKLDALVKKYLPDYYTVKDRDANKAVINELREYFSGQRREFSIKICSLGTEFQRRVWRELINIPYGKTCSYSDIAWKIGCLKGQRAVGMANNKNPLGIIIPCHRVIGTNGELTGYAGGLQLKERLLELEKRRIG